MSRFKKSERLSGVKNIYVLFSKGISFYIQPFNVIYHTEFDESDPFCKLLVAVPKKKIPKAVDRNKIKRLIRESYRMQKNEINDLLYQRKVSLKVIFVYTNRQVPTYNYVYEKIKLIILRLMDIIKQIETKNPDK